MQLASASVHKRAWEDRHGQAISHRPDFQPSTPQLHRSRCRWSALPPRPRASSPARKTVLASATRRATPAATAGPATAAAGGTHKRRRVSVGSTEEYEETCRLGKGGYGAVVKARHRATGQTFAIKRLVRASDPDGGQADAEEGLLREARFLEECDGVPFVVGFHGVVRDPATEDLCLVMECVGPSLHDFLRQRRRGSPPLPEATVRAVMWQLLTGAKKMHERGIVHRDIKPENVLLNDDHTVVKICDFGLAMSMSEAPPYEPAGTLWYKAPEMLLEMPDYGALVDTWSLGCVMAELITRKPLFQGFHEDGQLCAIFDVLGVPDDETWPGFSSTAFATEVLSELDVELYSHLRETFPEAKLSEQGFEVLNGLLTCNPEKRLTAAAALKLPWFAKVDALKLPGKDEVASALPKKTELLLFDRLKRRKLQCV
ncbi:hypothetical protein ACP70R_024782 [Stipagrostis hirtigluma subsp. patula]